MVTLVGISKITQLTGTHAVTIWRWVRDGKFPAPIYLQSRRRWRLAEVLAWLDAQAARPHEPILRGAVAQRAAAVDAGVAQ